MKGNNMFEKKNNNYKSPNLNDLQEVKIDGRTRIYVSTDEDPKKARERYLSRFNITNVYKPV